MKNNIYLVNDIWNRAGGVSIVMNRLYVLLKDTYSIHKLSLYKSHVNNLEIDIKKNYFVRNLNKFFSLFHFLRSESNAVFVVNKVHNIILFSFLRLFIKKFSLIGIIHSYKKRSLFLPFISFLLNKADEIIFVSKDCESLMKKDYSLKKTRTIYNALGSFSSDISSKKRNSHKKAPLSFVSLSRLDGLKGIYSLVRIFNALDPKKYLLEIYGEGDHGSQLKLVNKQSGSNVKLKGYTNNASKIISNADAFILNSHYEGFPTVLVESIQLGTPVVTSNCLTGPSEIMGLKLSTTMFSKKNSNGILFSLFSEHKSSLKELPLDSNELKLLEIIKSFNPSDYNPSLNKDINNKKIYKSWMELLNHVIYKK